MKKLLTLFVLFLGLGIANAQNDFDYSKSEIKTKNKLIPINLTNLKYEKTTLDEEEYYVTYLGFDMTENIKQDQNFWLLIIYEKNKNYDGFVLGDTNKKSISKRFYFTRIKDNKTILLQDNTQLTEEMIPGKYYLTLFFKEIPTEDNFFMINIAVNASEYYNGIRDFLLLTKELN